MLYIKLLIIIVYFGYNKMFFDLSTININNNTISKTNIFENNFILSFYFKWKDQSCNDNINNLFNLFINDEFLIRLDIFCENNNFFIFNYMDNNYLVNIEINKVYYFELSKNNNRYSINLFNIINSINNLYNFDKKLNLSNKNKLFLYINSNKSNIFMIIENYRFINNLDYIDNNSNLPYNMYFINFRHNHMSTLYLRNEYINEFGPSHNGEINIKIIDYSYKTSIYDNLTKEILWIDNNNNGYFIINKYVFTKIFNFEIYKSHFIYIKFDIGVSYKSSSNISNYDKQNNKILTYYNNTVKSNIKVADIDSIKYFFVQLKFNELIFLDTKCQILKNNFFKDSTIGLNFIFLNFINKFNSDNYNWKIGRGLNNNSILLDNWANYNEVNYSSVINLDKNNNNEIKYSSFDTHNIKYKFYFIHKEFVIGVGILNLNNNKIISPSFDRYFVYYDISINNLERRLHLDGNMTHRQCNNVNCSICKYNWNECLFCYQGYYLINDNCLKNNDVTKFVDKFNNLRYKKNYTSIGYFESIDYYPKNVSKYIKTNFYNFNEVYNNKSVVHLYYNGHYSPGYNVNLEIYSRSLIQKFSIYYKNVINLKISFAIFRYNSYNIGTHFGFENNINMNKIKSNYFYETINCNGNKFYVDFKCKYICTFDNSYYLNFDNKDIRYGDCKNNKINYKYKDPIFFVYNNCPKNCIDCNATNNIITCSRCIDRYILLNNYCVQNTLLNTVDSYIPFNRCNNYLTFCNNLNALSCRIKNNIDNSLCNISDIEIINCKNNYYLNRDKSNCDLAGSDEVCLNAKNDKCILCINTYYLFQGICNICSKEISNCYICSNKDTCVRCNNNYYLKNNNCLNCDKDCLTCNNIDQCLLCKDSFKLINGICIKKIIPFCEKYSLEKICSKCQEKYNLFDNTCQKCANGCLECINSKDNCIKCKGKYFLENKKCYSYYIFQCMSYDTNKKNCEICKPNYEIIILKKRKICYKKCNSNQFRNKNKICVNCNYNKAILIKNKNKYSISMELPNFLNNYNLLDNNYILINSVIGKIDFNYIIENKNLNIDLKIRSFKNKLDITFRIDKIFFKNNCLEFDYWENYKLLFKINPNKKFISDNNVILNKINPLLATNSTVYKSLKTIGYVSKSVIVSFSSTTILIAIFILPLLKYLSEFLEFLLIIQIFTLLKINFGPLLNTIFNLIKINVTFILNFKNIINLNEESIRNNKLISINPKISTEDIYLISNFSVTYLIGLMLIFIYILIRAILYVLNFRKNRKNRIHSKIKIKIYKKGKIQGYNNLWKLKYYWKYFYLNIIYFELPNIIFTTLIYIYNHEFLNFNGIFNKINIVLIINYFVISNFFYNNLKAITEYKHSNMKSEKYLIYIFFVPYRIMFNRKIIYIQLFENIRTLLNIITIIYINRFLKLQWIMISSFQLIYLIYILNLKFPTKYEKYFYKLKEIFNLILLILLSLKGFIIIDNLIYDIVVISVFTIWFFIILFNLIKEFIINIKNFYNLLVNFWKKQ